MKRINEYKKLFNIETIASIELRQLKKTYRNLVKEWHPDKFQESDPKAEEARIVSLKVIDAYHFLVSMAPETKEANIEEYTTLMDKSGIDDFKLKGQVLEVTFLDGSSYEYFGVTKNIYTKLINSDKRMRFAKRSIFNSFPYRKSKKETLQEA